MECVDSQEMSISVSQFNGIICYKEAIKTRQVEIVILEIVMRKSADAFHRERRWL